MPKSVKIILLVSLLIWMSSIYCSRKIQNPTNDYGEIEAPPTPQKISLSVGDGRIDLAWEVSDSSNVGSFKIYRSDTSSISPSFFDSCSADTFSYSDGGLKNGKEYFYQISSVDTTGFEGYKSEKVSAKPNLFAVIINNGQKLTNSRGVTLSLVAPSGTSYMMVSNDSLFSSSSWERYSSSKSWELEAGDGEKWVYVKFKDANGNVCIDFYGSWIILDTQAHIDSVLENTAGQVKTAGEIIHFTLYSKKINGQAKVDLGNINNIVLYDNGEFGDATSNDSIYELDYVIPPDVEMEEATVEGHFTDEAGNLAPVVTAPGKVTIRIPPEAVTLFEPSGQTQSSLTLYWSQSTAGDFYYYQLYRAKTSSVDTNSTLITTIINKSTTNYTDTDLEDTTTYYYIVYVYDKTRLPAGSNIVSGMTLKNQPPTPVVLSITSINNDSAVVLSWSENGDDDFESYRVYKSDGAAMADSNVVKIINQQSTTTFTDEDVQPDSTYYYKVFVYDKGGLPASSNQVSGP